MSEKARLVGARIRMVRLAKGLQQNEVAQKLAISSAHLSNIEKGRNNITLENLLKLHEVLECPVSSFFVDIDGAKQVQQEAENNAQQNPLAMQFSLAELLQALVALKK